MEEGTNNKQHERYSSGSSYSSSTRHNNSNNNKPDRPPQYDKIQYDQMSQASGSRYDKKQLVNDTVEKMYDRAQYEIDHLPPSDKTVVDGSNKYPTERYTNNTSSSGVSRYDKLARRSLTKSLTDASYRDHLRDKYERLDKTLDTKKSTSGDSGRGSSGKGSKSASVKSSVSKPTAGELAYLHGVCRCSAMAGRPHVHKSMDEKVSVFSPTLTLIIIPLPPKAEEYSIISMTIASLCFCFSEKDKEIIIPYTN